MHNDLDNCSKMVIRQTSRLGIYRAKRLITTSKLSKKTMIRKKSSTLNVAPIIIRAKDSVYEEKYTFNMDWVICPL